MTISSPTHIYLLAQHAIPRCIISQVPALEPRVGGISMHIARTLWGPSEHNIYERIDDYAECLTADNVPAISQTVQLRQCRAVEEQSIANGARSSIHLVSEINNLQPRLMKP
jgi:hypothetical protein